MLPDSRQKGFERPPNAEAFLSLLNEAMCKGEDGHDWRDATRLRWPPLFIVGAPRSGTTVLMQWLQLWNVWGIPTNFLARFPRAPYLGGLLQRLLTEPSFDFRGELSTRHGNLFSSEVGKTQGLMAAHEFFYFWRRFFPLERGRKMTSTEREQVDLNGFVSGLARLERGLDRPLAMKAMLTQFDLDLIADAIPNCIFVHTKRNEIQNCISILRSRVTVHGDENSWFSVFPPGCETTLNDSAIEQVASQVARTNDLLDEQLDRLPKHRTLVVDHSTFCTDSQLIGQQIVQKLAHAGFVLNQPIPKQVFQESTTADSRSFEIEAALNKVRAQ